MPKLLFVADGRSPIALNWIQYFVDAEYEVHLASTYPCAPELRLASLEVVPAAFSGAQPLEPGGEETGKKGRLLRRLVPVNARTLIRQRLGPLTLNPSVQRLRALIDRVQPDLVHAMRIPYEGILAALALGDPPRLPLIVSIWGNDFTLHARATPWLSRSTRLTLRRAAALHADCHRDLRLACAWGFPPDRPQVVLPGGGGVQASLFHPREPDGGREQGAGIEESEGCPTVINPRGFRAYVRNEAFFTAIPLVLDRNPEVRFLCPGMQAEPQAQRWVSSLGLAGSTSLLPRQTRPQMAELFRRAHVAVSPSTHDGTPNTLLEAMACGCFPIAGDLESLREWITPGANGLLVDPGDPRALADAILLALAQPGLRRRARERNLGLIAERAEYTQVMHAAEAFYRTVKAYRRQLYG